MDIHISPSHSFLNFKLAYSSKTDTFDISSSFGDPWYSISGTPLDLYFIELENELERQCALFANGVCDTIFNSIDCKLHTIQFMRLLVSHMNAEEISSAHKQKSCFCTLFKLFKRYNYFQATQFV